MITIPVNLDGSMRGATWVKLVQRGRELRMRDWIKELNELSLRGFSQLFERLALDETAVLEGVYRGTYVGPGWLRKAAPPAMRASGLGGWWGKRFEAGGEAFNLVERNGRVEPIFPMRLESISSRLDGAPALVLVYDRENPFPWPFIVDELRPLDETAVLGMTYLNVDAAPKLAFPFLIQRTE